MSQAALSLIKPLSTLLFISSLTMLAWFDLKTMRLPDALTLPLLASGLILNGLLGLGWASPWQSLAGATVGVVSFYLLDRIYLHFFHKKALGMGDAKLLGAIGAFWGLNFLPWIVLLACAFALIGGTIWLRMKQLNRSHYFPMGPFLAASGISLTVYQKGWLV